MSTWTDETKQQAIDAYLAAEPTPTNSMEIVEEIAREMGQTANGVRLILTKAGKYIKKDAAAPRAGAASGDKPARVSKEGAHKSLTEAIEAAGKTADSEIISKLTGKAAVYFTGLFAQ